jgi:hypothetical protein
MAIDQEANADGQDAGQEQGQEQGALQGNSLLTKPDADGEKKPEAGKDAGKEKGQDTGKDTADKVPDKPEGYALKFAEGIQPDKELLGSFQKAAHELGISQGKAQKLADMYAGHAAKAGERMQAEQQKALDAAKVKWEAEIEKSPNFTQERDHARAALRQYGDKELYDLLDQTNLGSHPKMWAFLAKVGKALAEPGFKGASASRGQKTAAEVLYPNQGKE